jgi:serine/threonine protein kinase
MTPERWELIKTILAEAIEMEPGARKEYVRQASAGDPDLFAEVVSLLDADSEKTLLDNPILAITDQPDSFVNSSRPDAPGTQRPHRWVGEDESALPGERSTHSSLTALKALSAAYLQPSSAERSGARFGSYRLLEPIGEGGMGVVYRAYDETRKRLVALKTLQRMHPAALYRFKREFRSFAELSHPNLVALYELLSDNGRWCFTMELVDGPLLMPYLTSGDAGDDNARLERLRDAFAQLADGVAALHAADKLHRDIKPNNVLVTADRRVVLVDFGLGADLDDRGMYQSTDLNVLGTVPYMSPEQAAGRAISGASDWYSVGVMLYQALTGRLPFVGTTIEVLTAKLEREPRAPGDLALHVPEDLNDLCVDLLRRHPGQRPTGSDVLRRLGRPRQRRPATAGSDYPHDVPFVGRISELTLLREAYATMRRGSPVIAYVHGTSGTGKSTLVQRFLDEASTDPEAVILTGRCYEQESVPFKALDSLVDSLAHHLRRLSALDVQAVMPRDVRPLARVFPVLWQIPAIADAPVVGGTLGDPQELRRRAAAALRELLARLGDRRRLILAIDDLQWGDLDSATLLTDILTPPDPPVFLGILCYRTEDVSATPFFGYLHESRSRTHASHEEREVVVDRLAPSDTRDLTSRLLPSTTPDADALTESIVRESAGRPFLVYELVEHARTSMEGVAAARPLTLDQALQHRIERLPDEPRRLLEIVAVAGRPIGTLDACRAAGLTSDDRSVLPGLRAGRLIRGTLIGSHDSIEAYHDRVRECVLAHLPSSVRRHHHRRLAEILSASSTVDCEGLAVHLEGAGEAEQAAEYYARAASTAAEALAFDHSALLYRRALALKGWNQAEGCALRTRMADALSNAGRGAEAAKAYLTAAADAEPALRLELRRRAALQLLTSGHVDEGLECLGPVLKSVGTRLAGAPWRALLSLLLRRLQLRIRGTGFRERSETAIDPAELQRIDVGWSAVVGLSIIDPIRGADFQTRSLLLALRAGEPFRIARALAVEAGHLSSSGAIGRATMILDHAEQLAARLAQPYAVGITEMARATVAYFAERWPEALQFSKQAAATFRQQCTGATWEIDTATAFSLWSLAKMGEVGELNRISPGLLKEAYERGDLYAIANLSTQIMAMVRLAGGDPEGARDELNRVMQQWTQNGYHVQHHDALLAFVPLELYCENPWAAWNRVQAEWSAFRWSLLSHVQDLRIEMLQLRAYCALAMAATSMTPERFLSVAVKDAARLRRERLPWTVALAQYIEGAVAIRRGDHTTGCEKLAAAVRSFDDIHAHLHAAATRWQLADIVGGPEGQDMRGSAERWFDGQGVAQAERMAAAYAPGLP